MSEIKGCMNCGNISCGNNKKRESAGCGRYISPEDKIKELEAKNAELMQKVEAYDRNRDRLIAMGFPHFRNCKEYAEKLKELEAQIEKMKCCGNCKHCKYSELEESYEWCEVHDQIVNIATQPCSEYETYNFDKAIKEIKEKC